MDGGCREKENKLGSQAKARATTEVSHKVGALCVESGLSAANLLDGPTS